MAPILEEQARQEEERIQEMERIREAEVKIRNKKNDDAAKIIMRRAVKLDKDWPDGFYAPVVSLHQQIRDLCKRDYFLNKPEDAFHTRPNYHYKETVEEFDETSQRLRNYIMRDPALVEQYKKEYQQLADIEEKRKEDARQLKAEKAADAEMERKNTVTIKKGTIDNIV